MGEAEEAARVEDVVEDTQESVEVVADAGHSHTKCLVGMEASPHLSMARHWCLYHQQEQG